MFRNADFTRLLIDDVVIQRRIVKGRDSLGGYAERFSTIVNTRGRLSITGISESERYNTMQEVADVEFLLFLLPNIDIQKNDRVFTKKKYFEVKGVKEPRFMKHHLEVTLEQIQPKIVDEVSVYSEVNIKGNLEIVEHDRYLDTIVEDISEITGDISL